MHTYIHTYIHTCIHTVAEWLAWLTSNCGRIGAIGSSPSNDLKPNLRGQKGFNPLCQCVYIYVCIVKPDIQTIHRCSHTSIHTYIHRYIIIIIIATTTAASTMMMIMMMMMMMMMMMIIIIIIIMFNEF